MAASHIKQLAKGWRRTAAAAAVGAALCLGVLGAGALIVVEFGLFDTRASTPHNVVVAWATHTAFNNSVRLRSSDAPVPAAFTSEQVQDGARQYAADCALCHGGPGQARAHWARGLVPTPPFLIDASRRWDANQLYFIVADGAKMTAMPAWRETRSPDQIWNLVAFLQALPNVTPAQYVQMTRSAPRTPPTDPPPP